MQNGHEFDLASGCGRDEDIFFPPEQWSRRFGSNFFTVRALGWKALPAFDVFELEVERGEDEDDGDHARCRHTLRKRREGLWVVQRRYSEFAALKNRLEARDVEVCDSLAPFPPKMFCWANRDQANLDARCAALKKWLYNQLKKGDIVQSPEMQAFLEL